MKTRLISGFAVLALLCLLPRLSALTITQTVTLSAASGFLPTSQSTRSAYVTFGFDRFDPALGALESVSFSTHTTGYASATDVNAWSFPIGNNPYLWERTQFSIAGAPDGFRSSDPVYYTKKPTDPTSIAPYSTVTYGLDFEHTITALYLTNFGAFVGPGSLSVTLGSVANLGSDSIGGSISQTSVGTLTYTFAGVPDNGATWLMLLLPIAGLAVVRRNKARVRQT